MELLGDVATLLLLAEYDLARVGLHQVVASGLGGDVLEDDLHAPVGPGPTPTKVAVGRYSTRAPPTSKVGGARFVDLARPLDGSRSRSDDPRRSRARLFD